MELANQSLGISGSGINVIDPSKTVVLLEDDTNQIAYSRRALEQSQYQVLATADWQSAVSLADVGARFFILDIRLGSSPNLIKAGLYALEAIRQRHRDNVFVAVLTALRQEHRTAISRLGADVAFDKTEDRTTDIRGILTAWERWSDNKYRQLEQELSALTEVNGRIRLLGLKGDGGAQFVDAKSQYYNLFYPLTNEQASLHLAVEELESLINDPKSTEGELHGFFESHPDFILTDDYKKAHSKIVLESAEGALIPDFVLEPFSANSLCDLLELKLPQAKVFIPKKNRLRYSADVFEAAAQLREYRNFFEEKEKRELIKGKYGLLGFRPRLFVIIGRTRNVDPLASRRAQEDLAQLTLRTYDDVLNRMKRKLR